MPREPAISFLELHLAVAGLGLVPNLPRRAVLVGMALLRHLNRKTWRCDPGIATLCKGTGMSRTSVMRGLQELCGGEGPLFHKVVHGGFHGTNRYIPNLARLKSYANDYDSRAGITKRTDTTKSQSQMLVPDRYQPVEPCRSQRVAPKPVESTNRNNQGDKAAKSEAKKALEDGPDLKRSKATKSLIKPPGSKTYSGKSRIHAKLEAADRRLMKAVRQNRDCEALLLVDENHQGAWAEAVEAESRKHGTGIKALETYLLQPSILSRISPARQQKNLQPNYPQPQPTNND